MDLACFFVWLLLLLLLYDGGEGEDGVDDFAAALADALSMPLSGI